MKKYDIEIIFKNGEKEVLYGYQNNISGTEIIRRIFERKSKNNPHILFAINNDAYLYDFDDIKHLKILEVD